MTDRELRLQEWIDMLTAERDRYHALYRKWLSVGCKQRARAELWRHRALRSPATPYAQSTVTRQPAAPSQTPTSPQNGPG